MTSGVALRLGTRGSALALAQAGRVRDAVAATGTPCELVVVRRAGPATAW